MKILEVLLSCLMHHHGEDNFINGGRFSVISTLRRPNGPFWPIYSFQFKLLVRLERLISTKTKNTLFGRHLG